MKSRDFCYWLQGAIEVGQLTEITGVAFEEVKNHLNMVFIHEIDPSFPKSQKPALDMAHHGDAEGIKMRC